TFFYKHLKKEVNMKKILLLIIAINCLAYVQAQIINAAEFFIDADPGPGNGTSINIPVPGTTVNFSTLISAAALSNGFHFVGIRTRDNAGKWGLFESRGFYISTQTSNVTNIVAAEFFIDTDPGVGSGTSIPVATGPAPTFVATIPIVALSNGFHFISIRTKDDGGKWGLFENRGFYITTQTTNVNNIVEAEFFVDTDPGIGNGTSIALTSGPNPTFVATVPTAALSGGFHFVSIRTKDADGKWGLFENRGFYISTQTNNVSDIVAAEFFVDTDPGVGNGTSVALTPGPNPTFIASVPTAALAGGFHFLSIRTKDAAGYWGLFENRGFYINTTSANVGNMIAAEYFIDTDPGVGNGTPFNIPNTANFAQDFVWTIPLGTTQGQHFVAIRVKNEKWGLYDFDTITVAGTLPLKLLSFNGIKNQSNVSLNWKTDNEINTAHFEVERSSNGVHFSGIGRVTAMNRAGENNYAFDDGSPFGGINFYRLKQVDIDGKYAYSNILRIMFENAGKLLNIYPNPATQFVQFDFSGKQKTILVNIFDAQGRHVHTSTLVNQLPLKLNIEKLAKGQYNVQLSDGEIVETGNFIKQ
ncbi:MAG: T9SS type A sorting domain-containing protein, partial [Ferruginibacter sp.]